MIYKVPYQHINYMEQSANPIVRLWTITRTIQAVTKDTSLQAYIWLLTAAAPSDCVFRALGTNWLTYLLTFPQILGTCWQRWGTMIFIKHWLLTVISLWTKEDWRDTGPNRCISKESKKTKPTNVTDRQTDGPIFIDRPIYNYSDHKLVTWSTSDVQIQIIIWFKLWLNHWWWFDLNTKDLI